MKSQNQFFLSFLTFLIAISILITQLVTLNKFKKTVKYDKNIAIDSFQMSERTRCIGSECFTFRDLTSSNTIDIVIPEIQLDYKVIDEIKFEANDVVIDVGAHIGMVSTYIGRKNPNVKIFAIEATPFNYNNLIYNLKLNDIKNVKATQIAISGKDNEELQLCFHPSNTGGSGACHVSNGIMSVKQKTITIDTFVKNNNIKKIKLLKIDCEGCEWSVFDKATPEMLQKIEYITGEVHMQYHVDNKIQNKNDIPEYRELMNKITKYVDKDKISFKVIDDSREIK